MNKTVKELRKTNAAARALRSAKLDVTQLLLLDKMLLELEGTAGLMDGQKLPQSAAE